MNNIESFIRHLQSSLDKRKQEINTDFINMNVYARKAKNYYESNDISNYEFCLNTLKFYKNYLKEMHKQQATETRMLKHFEWERSKHLLEI